MKCRRMGLAVMIGWFSLTLFTTAEGSSTEVCSGRFLNPITDICWSCLFPLTVGSMTVYDNEKPDTENPSNPVCACRDPVPRVGISIGFWEPVRLVDVTRHP